MTKGPSCLDCGTRLSQEPWAPELCPRCSLQLALEQSPDEVDVGDDPEALPTRQFPNHTFSSGQILGSRFQVRSLLGRGGMGEVWRAYDLKLRVDVALKSLRAELLEKERALQALRQEVRTAREVMSPNVCRVFDLVELDGQELVSMEYIGGTTLVKVLHSRGPLELQEAREIASQFLGGLEAIHQAGLVHRDLKPENIMITRSGRVVVMDFGIAKGLADRKTGTVSGTPAYMAPEQAQGREVDARADVFSAGVVLAEMIAPSGIRSHTAREAVWQGIHNEPPELPDTPWAPVLSKALARLVEQRYSSAAALARALEEVTLQVDGAEDLHPYPGLASFTEVDAEYFFGRELEVEAMWKKLRRPHLLGLIGPSGAGKSSFLRAGLLPVMPEGWRAVICNPGTSPFQNLARSLVPEFSGDTDATRELLSIEKLDVALSVFKRWRRQPDAVLVIVDQFEELFTLNPPEIQSRFTELLGSMSVDADVRVLLSMRDDFFLHCHEHSALSPIFSESTPLHAPKGTALRRALVQPALKCGYRFEDESLVEEMITEVSEERGALPALAFAAAQLWEHRDRERGLLTREAYEHIGGVGGALAQHAEATLEKIGNDRVPFVREIFRNLVTAQGTRAAREMEELLSVFENKEAAKEVLRALVDARLLTSFEVTAGEDEKATTRVEIIHESLLKAWPRLVRWQTQDEEGAQLRDELRQAAQLWEQHERSADRLWTGTAFREYQLWRERYSGGLTSTEEAFAAGMVKHAERRRRRKRLAVAAVITVLAGGLSIISAFWQRAEKAREEAVHEVRRREAAQILALGQLRLEDYPTAAMAHALASLELVDSPQARRFALEALWRGPTAFVLPINTNTVRFSPDGQMLATGGMGSGVHLWSREGGSPRVVAEMDETPPHLRFNPKSDLLGTRGATIRLWSLPDLEELRRIELGRGTGLQLGESSLITYARSPDDQLVFRAWPFGGGEPNLLARWRPVGAYADYWDANGLICLDINAVGDKVVYAKSDSIHLTRIENLGRSEGRLIGKHNANVVKVSYFPEGDRILAWDESGETRIWPLSNSSKPKKLPPVKGPVDKVLVSHDRQGSRWISGQWGPHSTSEVAVVWDTSAPPDAEPRALVNGDVNWMNSLDMHPQGNWAVTANARIGVVWPLDQKHALIFRGQEPPMIGVTFTPDGKSMLSGSDDGTLRIWPLSDVTGEKSRNLMEKEDALLGWSLRVDPNGRYVATTSRFDGRAFLTSLETGETRLLRTRQGQVVHPAFSPDGRRVALSYLLPSEIEVFDLHSGEVRTHEPEDSDDCGWEDTTFFPTGIAFTRDNQLILAGAAGIRLWNLEDDSIKSIPWCGKDVGNNVFIHLIPDGRRAVIHEVDGGAQEGFVSVVDLSNGSSQEFTSHGRRVKRVALDPAGKVVVTGDWDGVVRVGPLTGEEPHLLFGHGPFQIDSVAVSPDGRWIASGSQDGTIRLWPMPEGRPLHTLPYDELLERLRSLTNVRVVTDEDASSGYSLDYAPFPGWEKVPVW